MDKTLSIFIDESGDFGDYTKHSPYYMVSMVLHDQSIDISADITTLDRHIIEIGFPIHAVHTGPIIRRESYYYENKNFMDRYRLLNAMYHFTRKLDIHYICPCIDKSNCSDPLDIIAKLSREMSGQIRDHYDFFNSYKKIIIYYDNGQHELTKIITSIFSTLFVNVEYRKVQPSDYKLFQVADLICTWELLAKKADTTGFTRSEIEFFDSPSKFMKNRYKLISKKKL